MATTGFWWILLSVGLYGLLHSFLASVWLKSACQRLIGQSAYTRYYRFFFSVTGGITFIPSLLLVLLLPDQHIYSIPSPWIYLTLFLQGVAVIAAVLTISHTGAMTFLGLTQMLNPAAAPERLVTDGLYRYIRHPLYTLALLIIWLTPVLTWNILALNLGISAYLWVGSIFEERKLARQFGPAYESYKQRTPRLLPKIKALR